MLEILGQPMILVRNNWFSENRTENFTKCEGSFCIKISIIFLFYIAKKVLGG